MATTIIGMFRESAEATPDKVAYSHKQDGQWVKTTFGEASRRVESIGAGLIELGIEPTDRVCILANSRLEWSLVDYALLGLGATVVPIYQTNSAAECHYIIDNCNANSIVVEDASQLEKVVEVRGSLPDLATIVVIDPAGIELGSAREAGLVTLDELEQRGTDVTRERWRSATDAVTADTLATLIYTSGTTGPPKGCMLSNGNYMKMTDLVLTAAHGIFRDDDCVVLFLPLAHTFARLVQFVTTGMRIEMGFTTVPTLMDDLVEMQPTILPSVPRVFEKAHTRIYGMFEEATGLKRTLINRAMRVGTLRGKYLQRGRMVPPFLALQYAFYSKLVFSKIHARFGGKLRLCVSGGAPLSRDVQEFFLAAGIVILEGYGLTECSAAATLNLPDNFRCGSVGPILGDTEVKIADDGEVLIRGGQIFKGYYRNEEATAETISADGWLHSGDIGTFDNEGFLYITDRKKDIIVTAGGKNVSPQNIENALKATQYISQALVYGDRKPYLAALITLDQAEIESFAKSRKLPTDLASLVATPEVLALVQGAVEKVNASVGNVERVKRWRLLPIDFTQEAGEITPTLKLKRKVVSERYADLIEQMYGADAPDIDFVPEDVAAPMQQQAVATTGT